jgi:hypothetical protein
MIQVKSWPLVHYRARGFFAFITISFVTLAAFYFLDSYLFGLLAFFVITTPSMSFLFPATYSFKEEGFDRNQLGFTKEFKYDQFKNHRVLDDGVILVKGRKRYEFIYIFQESEKNSVSKLLVEKGVVVGE